MKKKFNLLLPIAGNAQRFIDVGINIPKPLIMVANRSMIDWALDSIDIGQCNLIFVVRLDHIYNFSIDEVLKKKFGNDIQIIYTEETTEGSVCTCLLAKNIINNDLPLIIYTPDVHFKHRFQPMYIPKDLDGFILTFLANSPDHSYVKTNKDGFVIQTAEKQVISQHAAVGVYYFKTGKMFVDYGEELIRQNIRTKNEFYLCPIYNLMVKKGLKIKDLLVNKMHVLGIPRDLDFFVKNVNPIFGKKPLALCCDHSGYELKEKCKVILQQNNIEFIDFGAYNGKDCDYSDYVLPAAKSIKEGHCDFGLGFCRTGQGINMTMNNIKGIRSALTFDVYTAEFARKHNCCNFFSIPSKYVDIDILNKMITSMLSTTFDGGRHMTRLIKADLGDV